MMHHRVNEVEEEDTAVEQEGEAEGEGMEMIEEEVDMETEEEDSIKEEDLQWVDLLKITEHHHLEREEWEFHLLK